MPGLDKRIVARLDFARALRRILVDTETDLIVAPHYEHLYNAAGHELAKHAASLLRDGKYETDLPFSISVPKARGFTRAGSSLHPIDRIVYQLIADELAVPIESEIDRQRVFSNQLIEPDPGGQMFRAASDAYEDMQGMLKFQARSHDFIVKLDIANYYERLPQHAMINLLASIGCEPELVSFTEKMLLAFQQRQSIGLPQGLFPSDLLGNFFLISFDAQCELRGVKSLRYSDDIYIPCKSYNDARKLLSWASDMLRRDSLYLNEAKSMITRADTLVAEEREVEELFLQTVNDLRDVGLDVGYYGYGFVTDMAAPIYDVRAADAEKAVEALQDLLREDNDSRPDYIAKIDKFALPILGRLSSDLGIDRALLGIHSRPYLTQIYATYLARFVGSNADLVDCLAGLAVSADIGHYEQMLLLRTLMNSESLSQQYVLDLARILTDQASPEPVRALAAMLTTKFGSAAQQRVVKLRYEDEGSPYMRAALLYCATWMTRADRNTCKRVWGPHSVVNGILASVLESTANRTKSTNPGT